MLGVRFVYGVALLKMMWWNSWGLGAQKSSNTAQDTEMAVAAFVLSKCGFKSLEPDVGFKVDMIPRRKSIFM